MNGDNEIYFDSFGVEHIPKEIKKYMGNKNITTSVFRVQAYDSAMCVYFCIEFIDFVLTLSVPEKLKNLIFEIPIVPQKSNINN